jgi:hypothetical protein
MRPVSSTNARRDTFPRVDADGKRRPKPRGILSGLGMQSQRIAGLFIHRKADKPPAELRHKVDRLGRSELGCGDKIAFIFAVLIVNKNDHTTIFEVFNNLGNTAKLDHNYKPDPGKPEI